MTPGERCPENRDPQRPWSYLTSGLSARARHAIEVNSVCNPFNANPEGTFAFSAFGLDGALQPSAFCDHPMPRRESGPVGGGTGVNTDTVITILPSL